MTAKDTAAIVLMIIFVGAGVTIAFLIAWFDHRTRTRASIYGFSHSEAAGILGAALGTVKSHVLRGRERLITREREGA